MTELRATYRLQLGGGFGFAQARELVPYLRDLGVSHLYLPPSFQARAGSTHGYDVVDPTSISAELGGEREFEALAREVRAAGMGLILDIVPNHMATDDANRYWSDPELRRRYFDLDEATGRHRRFFDIDHLAAVRQEDEEVFDETHESALALVARHGRRAADRPPGRARRPRRLPAPAARGRRAPRWVEKILDPGEPLRDWPVEGTVGYEFLNDVAALFVDPAGEAPLTALWDEISGDRRPFPTGRRGEARAGAPPFAPEVDRLRREAPREVGGLERALASLPSTAPTSSRGRARSRTRTARRSPRPGCRVADARAALGGARLGRVRDPLPADHAAGDGQGRRGHRVLPLPAAARAQRRRRRSGPLRISMGSSTRATPCARSASHATCWSPRRTTRSARATCGRGSAPCRRSPARGTAHVRRWLEVTPFDLPGPDAAERYLVLQTLAGAGRSSPSGSRPTWRRR